MTLTPRLFLLLVSLSLAPAAHSQATAPTPAPAQTPSPFQDQLRTLTRDELECVKVLTKQQAAWNKADLDTFAIGYKNSPEIIFVGSSVSRGFDQMLATYKKNYPTKETMGTLTFTDLEPHVLDDKFAVILGHYKLERSKKGGGNAEGIFSLVMEKTKDGWKIIVDHTTS
jgi:ketosteroid isomerase-like protein